MNLQVLHICSALTQGSTRLMKTGSKYILSDGRRMELWIMTAWLADNHLLTCLTHSWTVCLPAWLLLSTLCQSYLSPAMYPVACVSTLASPSLAVCLTVFLRAWLSPPSLSPFPITSDCFYFILCFSSSTSIDQPLRCILMSLHRELSCIPRLKPTDGRIRKEAQQIGK